MGTDTLISPFQVQFPEQKINDMMAGIRSAVIPDTLDDKDLDAGITMSDYRALLQYWKESYSWTDAQSSLNQLAQFKTEIQGVNLHFIHERSRHENATPIIIAHGWPSGPFEYRKVIPQLTKQNRAEDAFHVVVPSLPGCMFSEPSTTIDYTKVASLYLQLMERLGYERYIVYGADLGLVISSMMVSKDSGQHCMGLHLQGAMAFPRLSIWSPLRSLKNLFSMLWPFTPLEKLLMKRKRTVIKKELAFMLEQMTKPRTMGLLVAQSPAATAAWIAEKFISWTDSTGVVIDDSVTEDERLSLYEKKLDFKQTKLEHCKIAMDDILTMVALFWLTETLPNSMWLYRNSFWFNGWALYTETEIPQVPVGISTYLCDITWSPNSWVRQQYHDVIQQKFHPNGGHFPALEQPDDVVADIIEFNRRLRGE